MPEVKVGEERTAELFGILQRRPEIATSTAGKLCVSELLEPVHDESIASLFAFVGEELEVTLDQFLAGCEQIVPQPGQRIIGFVRVRGMLWTFSRIWKCFEADAPGTSHKARNPGDLILTPAFQQPILPPVLPVICRSHPSIRF